MGIHLNKLIYFLKRHLDVEHEIPESHSDTRLYQMGLKGYLEDLVRRAALFEIPILAEHIQDETEKDDDEFDEYWKEYFQFSKKYGEFFITPFRLTAVEDSSSVVFLEKLKEGGFISTSAAYRPNPGELELMCGYVLPHKLEERHGFFFQAASLFHTIMDDKGNVRKIFDENPILTDIGRGIMFRNKKKEKYEGTIAAVRSVKDHTISCMAQVAYIMDPGNFIIRKQSTECLKHNQKKSKRKRNMLKTTRLRPHYICLSTEDLRAFLKDNSSEPFPAHPVHGHRRYFKNLEVFINKNPGDWIDIDQYLTGDGIVHRQGWNYEVMIKETKPIKVVPYHKAKKRNKKAVSGYRFKKE
jgi:hypothetical protein